MKRLIFYMCCLLFVFSCGNKEKRSNGKTADVLEEYVYIDNVDIIHVNSKCNAIYSKNHAQPITPIIPRHIWCPKSSSPRFCSKCVSAQQMKQVLNIVSSVAYQDRLWLYEKLRNEYDDIDGWELFNTNLDDINKRKALYEEIKDKYNLGNFEEFNENLTNYDKKSE